MPDLYPRTRARLREWEADANVLGVLLVGSRSRGHGDPFSDDDLEVLLSDTAFAQVDPSDVFAFELDPSANPPRYIYDARMTTLTELQLKQHSTRDIDHWPYERAAVLFERSDSVTEAVEAAASMSASFRRARIEYGALDIVLAIARATKAQTRGFRAATHMLVARGARALSRVLFALENRWEPLDAWLEPELATLLNSKVAPWVVKALVEGDYEHLQTALTLLQPTLLQHGLPPPGGYAQLQSLLTHPSRASDRAIHALE